MSLLHLTWPSRSSWLDKTISMFLQFSSQSGDCVAGPGVGVLILILFVIVVYHKFPSVLNIPTLGKPYSPPNTLSQPDGAILTTPYEYHTGNISILISIITIITIILIGRDMRMCNNRFNWDLLPSQISEQDVSSSKTPVSSTFRSHSSRQANSSSSSFTRLCSSPTKVSSSLHRHRANLISRLTCLEWKFILIWWLDPPGNFPALFFFPLNNWALEQRQVFLV